MADTIISNEQSATITSSGGKTIDATLPIVALYGWCALHLEGDATLAGNKLNVAVYNANSVSHSIDVTLDRYGNAEISLMPFIRAMMAERDGQAHPILGDGTDTSVDDVMREYVAVHVLDYETQNEQIFLMFYIFGNNVLDITADRYINFNTGDVLGTWQTLDYSSEYDASGVPTDISDWQECNYNLNRHLVSPSNTVALALVVFKGGSIVKTTVNYHLIEDCRVVGVRALRWIDSRGGVNIRKLTHNTEAMSVERSGSYERPHTDRNIPTDNYWHGDDRWETITANDTINLGDDAIPLSLYDWLKELATSPVVELYNKAVNVSGGTWIRCNVSNVAMVKDMKKGVFSLSLDIVAPTYVVQEF